jgi:AsmA protein
MTKLRFLGFLALGTVALLGAALITVWLTVDPNHFKPRIASAVKASTGRELKLSGDIKLSVFPRVSLELGPASLGNPPGFGDEPFLSLKSASVRVKLLPLLRKRLEVAKLEVDGLDVRLRKNAQGKGNWQLAETKPEAPTQADAVLTPATRLESIANIRVQAGRVSYEGLSVENINFETGSLSGDRHIPVSATFDLKRAPSGAQMALNAKFDLSEGSAGQLQFGNVNSSGTQSRPGDDRPVHWELTASSLSLDLAKQTLALPAFALIYSSAHLTGNARGTKILDDLSLTGSLTLEPLVLREFAPRLGFTLPATRDPKALSQLSATLSYRYDATAITLSQLQARLDDTTLQGNFKLLTGQSDAIQFDLAADQIDLDRYRAPEAAPAARESSVPAKEDGGAKPLDVHGILTVKSAHVAKLDVTDLRVTLAAKDKVMHLFPLEAQLEGGRYSGNITVDAQGAIPILSVDEHLSGVDMAKLLANTAGKGRLSGRATINLKGMARGADVDADLKSLNGNLDANLADGALEGIDVAYEISLAQALLNKSIQASASNSGRTKFDTFKTSVQIANGIAQTNELTIASQALKVTGQGSANLATKAVDFKLLASVITAPARTTEIPLKVSGTYASLSVKPDVEAVAKDQIKQKLQDVLKKNGLQGLFSK